MSVTQRPVTGREVLKNMHRTPAARRQPTRTKRVTARRKRTSHRRNHITAVLAAVGALVVLTAAAVGVYAFKGYGGESDTWVMIPRNATREAVGDSIHSSLDNGGIAGRVVAMWRLMGGDAAVSAGAYKVKAGQSAFSIARAISRGRQTPVTVTFGGTRTMDQLASRIAAQLQCTPEEFLAACDSILPPMGYERPEWYPAAFIPDTYEFYWSDSPANVVKRLVKYRDGFWTPERRAKAKSMGLTPVGVATIASIVEEETAKSDERPKVARLYINRLDRGMKLQADPTVKFALGDFSLRRINHGHLSSPSPYNTYRVGGLPPGPIRVAEKSALEAVLDAPRHNYIYMCAKEDFSGYHNFAADYSTHQANAARYQAELNRRGIK